MTSEQATKEDALKAGREALARSAWQEAFQLLSAADAQAPLAADDLDRLGDAAMWALKPDECIAAYERAFAAHVEAGNRQLAARAARLLIAELNATVSGESVVAGWISRLARLLKDEPECAEHGYFAYIQSQVHLGMGDTDQAFNQAQQAFDLGGQFEDRDLQALGLHTQGMALVAKGEVAEGMALLNEAATAAVAGELGILASCTIYCNIVGTSRGLSDYGAAGEWIDAAKRWCERTAMVAAYPGTCRIHRAEVMRLRGAFAEAEEDARKACDELRNYPPVLREALYELGEIRLRTGDLMGAEDLFRQAQEMGRDPQPGLALVRLAQGQLEAAGAMIRRALAEDSERLPRARLLPAQVEITLARDDLSTARSAVEEMEDIAGTYGTTVLRATALCCRATLQLAEGDQESALGNLRQGLRLWQEIDAPYEAARARMCAAAAYRAAGDEESALLELQSARATFGRLGANLWAARARELLEMGTTGGDRAAAPPRATKTFMFTDIIKSTNLIEAIGDEAWNDLLNWHDKTLRSLFASHQGEEFKHGGDGFSVAFESARLAVDCAIAIQSTLAEHRRNHGFALQVRIGLHTSEVTRRGADYGGKGVHEAARISALAGAEEIVASADTLEAAGAGISASDPRSVTLKGISKPVSVVAINWR